MLIHITNLLDVVVGELEQESNFLREIKSVVNDMNSSLSDYEVRLVHLDTEDYIEFVRLSDEEYIQELNQEIL